MRVFVLAAAMTMIATPGLCLDRVAAPGKAAPARAAPMRELPDDWLDKDLGAAPTTDEKSPVVADAGESGAASDDSLAGNAADCRPSSGTTGAILGAVAGGLLGNVIDGGRHRAAGTIVGAGGGALLGREVEKKRSCR